MPKWPLLLIIVIPGIMAIVHRWLEETEDKRHVNRMADESRRKMIREQRQTGIN